MAHERDEKDGLTGKGQAGPKTGKPAPRQRQDQDGEAPQPSKKRGLRIPGQRKPSE